MSAEAAYSARYLGRLATVATIGWGAALGVFFEATSAITEAYWAVVFLWAGDVILGTARALRDPAVSFRWSKMGDALLRLVVILVLPPLVAVAALLPVEVGIDAAFQDLAVSMAIAILGVQEFLSVLGNAEFFFPRLADLRVRLIGTKDVPPEE